MRALEQATAIAWRAILMAVKAAGVPARQQNPVALYLLVVVCNVPGAVAARAAGCSKQNVSKILRGVEARRDDAAFDRQLAELEEIAG